MREQIPYSNQKEIYNNNMLTSKHVGIHLSEVTLFIKIFV